MKARKKGSEREHKDVSVIFWKQEKIESGKQEREGRLHEEQTWEEKIDKPALFITRPKPTSEEQTGMWWTEGGGVEHETGEQHFYLVKSKDKYLI